MFRDSSLRLAKQGDVLVEHRFLLGRELDCNTRELVAAEQDTYHDLLFVDAGDTYNSLTEKMLEGWRWSTSRGTDYIIKTDDDMFVRFDTVLRELAVLGRRMRYWRGFAYTDIPAIRDTLNKNSDLAFNLGSFPPYTAGALAILSRDVVELAAPKNVTRLLLHNEDQSLGVWLYATGIKPIHDERIQQAHVCEKTQIAKHFASHYVEPKNLTMVDMYENIVHGRDQCKGFLQDWCGVCYNTCRGRKNHWHDWGFACDGIRGASLWARKDEVAYTEPVLGTDAEFFWAPGTKHDPWIVPGVLSTKSSVVSRSAFHRLHMMCWTTSPELFQERHYQAIETLFVHEPDAILIVLALELPTDFLSQFTDQGYDVHIVPVSRAGLMSYNWILGANSAQWVDNWDRWASGPYFFSHLTDYLRYVFLYKYGGVYLDMDAPWIRRPPNAALEFIGADYSTVASDADWTLDDSGMYLAPGVMRFRPQWTIFKDTLESVFGPHYDPACFNCVGPRAITRAVKSRLPALKAHGFTIVPSEVLYPKNWVHSVDLIEPVDNAEAQLADLGRTSWSIHLFGKMTNYKTIAKNSITGAAFSKFSLNIARPRARATSDWPPVYAPALTPHKAFQLVAPAAYTYRAGPRPVGNALHVSPHDLEGSVAGTFEGLDAVFIRCPRRTGAGRASVTVRSKGVLVSLGPSLLAEVQSVEWTGATCRDINVALSTLRVSADAPDSSFVNARAKGHINIDVAFHGTKQHARVGVL